MQLNSYITRYINYNAWANDRLTTFLLTLDRTLLYQDTQSSFRTIDGTLQHILAAQTYWHELIFHGQINDFNVPDRVNAVEQIITELNASSQKLVSSLAKLTDAQLTERIAASDSTQSRYDYLLHVGTHSAFHRGQIITLCRMLGVTGEIPVTDFDAYLWWIENM